MISLRFDFFYVFMFIVFFFFMVRKWLKCKFLFWVLFLVRIKIKNVKFVNFSFLEGKI